MKLYKIILFFSVISLQGCFRQNTWSISGKYVGPKDAPEVREIDFKIEGNAWTRNTVLQDFPRTLDEVWRKFVEDYKTKAVKK